MARSEGRNATRELKRQQMVLKQNLPPSPEKLTPQGLVSLRSVEAELGKIAGDISDTELEAMQLRALAATWQSINSSLDLNTVLNQALDQVISLTSAERGYILWKKASNESLSFRIVRAVEQDPTDSEFQISQTIVNMVMTSGEPVLTDNAAEDAAIGGSASIQNYAIRSVLCVPLRYKGGEVFGVVYVANRQKVGLFSERELQMLTSFSDMASVAIENARQFTLVKAELQQATQEVERLRIEINQSKLNQQVSEITDSDFFKDLQLKARRLNKPSHNDNETG
jgi:GAF domain-containing protein